MNYYYLFSLVLWLNLLSAALCEILFQKKQPNFSLYFLGSAVLFFTFKFMFRDKIKQPTGQGRASDEVEN